MLGAMYARAGAEDVRRAADELAARLPSGLAPLARLAFDYRWSWTAGGDALFATVDPHRWQVCRYNPVRLLTEAPTVALERAASNAAFRRRAYGLEECIVGERKQAPAPGSISPARPVAFFCAEYGIRPSLPIYAGGLGVLAGDLLKAASDQALPLVGVGLLYRQGYFRQRIEASGWQHEYWIDTDPELLPAALVTGEGLEPVTVSVPIRGRDVVAQIWRIDVGRVPLFLLDTDRPDNALIDRWITSRLYVGDRDTRLAQYALLGMGGVRALHALGIEPGVVHLNEGHATLAALELAAGQTSAGVPLASALEAIRERIVFTTHTPVPAGNEAYAPAELTRVLSGLPERLGASWDELWRLARVEPDDAGERPGLTPLALRLSRHVNGVSRRHGEVARSMWTRVFRTQRADEVPIAHVTNGVHLPTWMADPVRELLDSHLGPGWQARSDAPATWKRLDDVPDAALWSLRCQLRARLVEQVRERATFDRLTRGEPPDYVDLAARAFDPEVLTIGFARRLATYKRMQLLTRDLGRSLKLLSGERPIQILLAGKAHPADEGAKQVVQLLFQAKGAPFVGERIAYLHDYDMALARDLVAGCDVWVNLPRPPLEASGTSGMKAALNGGIHLSVLDGWWSEGFASDNGWAIPGETDGDHEAQDARHAGALLDLLEKEVVPAFYERDADGLPRAWLRRVRASLRTAGLQFTARRMLADYVREVYTSPGDSPRSAAIGE
jgi:starch phosphorylase